MFRGLSRAAAKEKNFDWLCCDLDAWVPHSFFSFLFLGGPLFFFNVPAWGVLSLAVGLREIGQGH